MANGFRTELYVGLSGSMIPENLQSINLSPKKISKNPACVVNDFVDLMNGDVVKFNQIALWSGQKRVQSLSVILLDEKKLLLRAKINMEYYSISSKFESKILGMKKHVDLPTIEITFCSSESFNIVMLLTALVKGNLELIKIREEFVRLEWMPSMQYAWTHLAREVNYSTKLKDDK